MTAEPTERLSIEQEELRGVSRTVAEIEWLLLILVLVYQVFEGPKVLDRAAIAAGLFFYAAFVIGFRFFNISRIHTRWKIAFETLVMILFITWSLWHTGKLESPLTNAYLLVIITCALTLGKAVTMIEMVLIAACFVFLAEHSGVRNLFTLSSVGGLVSQFAPMLLVAYVTTMFAADIRYGLNQAKVLSETDALTGVFNMRGFAIVASRLVAQADRYNRPASILMIDSDNLKTVNDTHGHEAGNRLLKLVSKCIETELRHTDVLARYGGDEFVALLPESAPENARAVAERIRASIAATPLEVAGSRVSTSVSIGVAGYPGDGRSLDAVLAHADRAMYAAKEQGRNRVVKYTAQG